MHKYPRILIAPAFALLSLFLLSLLLGGTPTPTEAAEGSRSIQAPALALQATTAEDDFESLAVGLTNDPPTLDINLATDADSSLVMNQLMEALFRYRGDGTIEPAGALTYTASSDAQTYTVTLRSDARWADGQLVTAQHYVDGMLRLLDPDTGAGLAFLLYPVEGAEEYNTGNITNPNLVGIAAPDDQTLVFTLRESAAYFPSIMTTSAVYPVRLDLIASDPDWTEASHFVGNGPYTLVDWVHWDYLLLEKRLGYHHADSVEIEEIRFSILDAAQQLAAYQLDQLDVSAYPDSERSRILSDPVLGDELRRTPRPGVYYLGMNTQLTPTQAISVRKALASAIDRDDILTNVLNVPWREAATSVIPPGIQGYQNGQVGHTFDVTQAQAYLADAGYPGGAGLPAIELWANFGNEAVVDAVASQWETYLGVTVTTSYTDWTPYLDALQACFGDPGACDYNAYRLGWIMDYADARNLLVDLFHPDSALQYTGWDNTRYRQLMISATLETDPVVRTGYLQEADQILVEEEAAVIPLYFYDQTALIKPGVTFEYPPSGPPHFMNWVVPPPARPLVVGHERDPNLDYHQTQDSSSFGVLMQLMEGLMEYRSDGTVAPAGALTYTVSPDARVYTLTLRSDAYWSDGEVVTAQHYVDGILRLLDPNINGNWYAQEMYVVQNAEGYHNGSITDPNQVGVEALAPFELQFTLEQPAAHFPTLMATPATFPARLDVIESDAFWTEPGHFVSNGPYRLTAWTHGSSLTARRNPYYYDAGQVDIEEIRFRILAADQQLPAYENDLLDVAVLLDNEASTAWTDPVLRDELYQAPRPGVYYLGMNVQLTPTDAISVRKALASAIDRKDILTNALNMPWREAATSVIPPSIPGYQNEEVGHTFDVTQAQAYLAEAGYPGGAGLPTIELWANAGNEAAIDAVAAQWEANLGITVTTVYTEWPAYMGALSACHGNPGACNYNAYRLGWVTDYPDANNLLNVLFHPDSDLNHTGWDDARYRQLISMTLTETNQISRTAYFQEADQILVEEDVAVIPLFFYDAHFLVKADVLPEFMPGYWQALYKNWRIVSTVTATITSTGGTVSSPDGDVSVDFPPDTVSDTAAVTYTTFQLPPSPPTGTFSFAGNGFDMEMTDLTSGAPITTFVKPVTVTINYTEGDLAGRDESTLKVWYWNGSAWVDDGITTVERDLVNNRLVLQIEHLTKFGLFGQRRIMLPLVLKQG
jgi:oligopeptide transport system substrate-binding protein